jgi:hypothetical protein
VSSEIVHQPEVQPAVPVAPSSATPLTVESADHLGTDDSFSGLLVRPYNLHIAALAHLNERAALAAALAPKALAGHIRDGATLALDRYGANLAPTTSNLVSTWLQQHTKLADQLSPSWQQLSDGSAGELVRSFKAGFSSKEAKVGTAIGSVLGGWGGVIGGVFGGLVAMQRDDRAFSDRLRAHLVEVDRWFAVLATDFDARVLPRVERDLNPWPHRLRWVVGAAVVVAGAAAAAWFLY